VRVISSTSWESVFGERNVGTTTETCHFTKTSVGASPDIRTLNIVLDEFVVTDVPRLEASARESERFGLRVARLTVPVGCLRNDQELAAMCGSAPFDLIFVRAPIQRAGLGEELSRSAGREIRAVETLVYFEWDLSHASTARHRQPFSMKTVVPFASLRSLIEESFAGYKNHYSANPHLSAAVTADAYVEWAHTLLEGGSCRLFAACDESSGDPIGFILSSVDGAARSAEVVLNGVSPTRQREGVYAGLMTAAAQRLREDDGVLRLAISTQSTNFAVIEAWKKLGLRESLSLNTFHFSRA
jgi:GNAT superfamily N-acetyltransferase